MDFKKLKDSISELVSEGSSNEAIQKLGAVLSEVEKMETEMKSLVDSSNELRKDYIELVKSNSFKPSLDEGKEDSKTELSLEECLIKAKQNSSK